MSLKKNDKIVVITRELVIAATQSHASLLIIIDMRGFGPLFKTLKFLGFNYFIIKCIIEIMNKLLLYKHRKCLKFLHDLEDEVKLIELFFHALKYWVAWKNA
jgi:hypothetical protein